MNNFMHLIAYTSVIVAVLAIACLLYFGLTDFNKE